MELSPDIGMAADAMTGRDRIPIGPCGPGEWIPGHPPDLPEGRPRVAPPWPDARDPIRSRRVQPLHPGAVVEIKGVKTLLPLPHARAK